MEKRKIIEYVLVSSGYKAVFVSQINKHLKEGFALYGPLMIIDTVYKREMVKYDVEEIVEHSEERRIRLKESE
jgi:hypothetical protein